MHTKAARSGRRIHTSTYLWFYAVFALVLFLLHVPFLKLPYYWDELGQFVPAALDLFRAGLWIPHSVAPNVHPPGVMAYLALFWKLAGYSVPATRVAMLLLASAGMLVVFLLAIQLCRDVPGFPAFLAVGLLCISPLFYAQAMLAQLDMPAMLFTCLALLLFIEERPIAAALACTALVLMKETGVVVPVVLGLWLWREKRLRDAVWFGIPLLVLAAWLAVLFSKTGQLFGNVAFTQYNLYYPLNPVRLALALGRRLFYLFVADFHWIGTIAIAFAWRRTKIFATRPWKIAAWMVAAHAGAFSVLGGAVLERYLLPVLPIVYIAMAAAISTFSSRWKIVCQVALAAGLVVGNFWNPPYPCPLENNLAFTDFVRLQQTAAKFVEERYPGRVVATAWPLSVALVRPDLGYVDDILPVRPMPDFSASSLRMVDWADVSVLILYSRGWNPGRGLFDLRPVREFRTRYYGFKPELSSPNPRGAVPMQRVGHWFRRGQWIDVYIRRDALNR